MYSYVSRSRAAIWSLSSSAVYRESLSAVRTSAILKSEALCVLPAEERLINLSAEDAQVADSVAAETRLDDVSASTLIADAEQVVGGKSVLLLSRMRFVNSYDEEYVLYLIYETIEHISYDYGFDSDVCFNVFRYAFLSGDMDVLLDFMKSVYDVTWFPGTRRLFKAFSKILYLFWGWAARSCGAAGLYMELSGKLSRHLLTKAQTAKLRIGKTSAGRVSLCVTYRYRQTHSETGAYGLSVWYYTRSNLIESGDNKARL